MERNYILKQKKDNVRKFIARIYRIERKYTSEIHQSAYHMR